MYVASIKQQLEQHFSHKNPNPQQKKNMDRNCATEISVQENCTKNNCYRVLSFRDSAKPRIAATLAHCLNRKSNYITTSCVASRRKYEYVHYTLWPHLSPSGLQWSCANSRMTQLWSPISNLQEKQWGYKKNSYKFLCQKPLLQLLMESKFTQICMIKSWILRSKIFAKLASRKSIFTALLCVISSHSATDSQL